jgi:hypothetical protein
MNLLNAVTKFAEILLDFFLHAKDLIVASSRTLSILFKYTLNNLDYDQAITIGIILGILCLLFIDKIINSYKEINSKIGELENQIVFLKKRERMRENDWELLMQSQSNSSRIMREEIEKKFKIYDKQMKRMNRELKMFE